MTGRRQAPPRTARETALRALNDVDVRQSYANLALDAHLNHGRLAGRDRALATELVYGVVRRRGSIDWVIGQIAARPLDQIDPLVRNILRMAVYQILYMERIPHSAAVDQAVELAKQYGHSGLAKFVNGVLRNVLRRLSTLPWPDAADESVAAMVIRYSHPEWLVREWTERYGPVEAARLMEASNRVPPLTVRTNLLKGTREQVAQALTAEGVVSEPTHHSPQGLTLQDLTSASALENLKAMKSGLFTVQDESSMLVGPVVNPLPGQTVIDMASAPGGKATHVAELMQNKGKVLAVELHAHKVALIEQNARRLGTGIVEGVCMDARTVGSEMAQSADAILCDVPCSGLGTLARRPDARWRKSPQDIAALVPVQRAILDSAAAALKPGGTLVYSTCTIEPRENEELLSAFAADHPEFAFTDIAPFLPPSLAGEVRGWYVQLLPHHHGTDGFFIGRMKKRK